MKKKLKGFTLIELIVVIAIIGIIMFGIMQMFAPISNVYSDTSVISNQRAAEEGIASYIAENLRYATHIGIYQNKSSADDAMDEFLTKHPLKVDHSDPSGFSVINDKSDLDLICISNTVNYSYDGSMPNPDPTVKANKFQGRIIRKLTGQSSFNQNQPFNYDGTGASYMAMGDAYYGTATYYIRIENFSSAGFDIVVDSDYYYSAAKTKHFERTDNSKNLTRMSVILSNTGTTVSGDYNHVVDFSCADSTVGSRTNMTKDTYIVFYVEKDV